MMKFFGAGIVPAFAAAGLHEFVGGPLREINIFWLLLGAFGGGIIVNFFIGTMRQDGNGELTWPPYANLASMNDTISLTLMLTFIYTLNILVRPSMPLQAALCMLAALMLCAVLDSFINRKIAVMWGLRAG